MTTARGVRDAVAARARWWPALGGLVLVAGALTAAAVLWGGSPSAPREPPAVALRHAQALVALPGNEAQKANDETRLAMVVEKTEGPVRAARVYRQILAKYPERFCAAAKWRLKEIEGKIEDAVLGPDR
jgi:hypothetical protein